MHWHQWLEHLDLAGLLPGLRAHVPRLREALEGFLGSLSPARQKELWQMLEPFLDLSSEAQVFVLLRACPTLHKLGQAVSRDARLPPTVRYQLERLESLPPSTPVRLPAELRPGAPLAEGSVAVVVALPEGVAKVLKPGVAERLHEELSVIPRVAERLSLAQREVLEQVVRLLTAEVDLLRERSHLQRAGREGLIRVPALLPAFDRDFFTMERLDTIELTRATRSRFSLAHEVWSRLVAGVVFASSSRLVHLDPHPGNLRLGTDGRLVLLDWSLAFELPESWRRGLVELALGRQLGRPDLMHEGVARLLGHPPEPGWLNPSAPLLDCVAPERMPGRLLLWRKSLHTLEQLTRQLAPELVPETVLAEGCAEALWLEGPWRWWNPGYSGPLSQVSNQLLARLALSSPAP
ncbi:hypothetical protein DYH09_00130 [bacterium CPR1]|nr:hypothetical protein [bacterium CPR1]